MQPPSCSHSSAGEGRAQMHKPLAHMQHAGTAHMSSHHLWLQRQASTHRGGALVQDGVVEPVGFRWVGRAEEEQPRHCQALLLPSREGVLPVLHLVPALTPAPGSDTGWAPDQPRHDAVPAGACRHLAQLPACDCAAQEGVLLACLPAML